MLKAVNQPKLFQTAPIISRANMTKQKQNAPDERMFRLTKRFHGLEEI